MGSLVPIAHSSIKMMKLLALVLVFGAAVALADPEAYRGYGYRGYLGKRSADAEPEAEATADADADAWRYGYYGYGGCLGKRSADAEPEATADADADAWRYGYYGGYYGGYRPTAILATDTGTARGLPMLSLLLMLMPGGTTATATDCGPTATTGPTPTATRTMVEQFHPFYVSVL